MITYRQNCGIVRRLTCSFFGCNRPDREGRISLPHPLLHRDEACLSSRNNWFAGVIRNSNYGIGFLPDRNLDECHPSTVETTGQTTTWPHPSTLNSTWWSIQQSLFDTQFWSTTLSIALCSFLKTFPVLIVVIDRDEIVFTKHHRCNRQWWPLSCCYCNSIAGTFVIPDIRSGCLVCCVRLGGRLDHYWRNFPGTFFFFFFFFSTNKRKKLEAHRLSEFSLPISPPSAKHPVDS